MSDDRPVSEFSRQKVRQVLAAHGPMPRAELSERANVTAETIDRLAAERPPPVAIDSEGWVYPRRARREA